MQQQESLFSLNLDSVAKSHLLETAKWARLLAVIGMILMGIIVLFGIFFSTIMASMVNPAGEDAELGNGILSSFSAGFAVIYLVIAVVWFIPLLYLYRFAGHMKIALLGNDQGALQSSLQNLKICFRYVGIVTIIVLVIYLLVFLIALLGASMIG